MNRHWAECATIEISLDVNGNGLADDPWFLIPGSHLAIPPTLQVVQWDDDFDDASLGPQDESWLPAGKSGQWSTQGFRLSSVFEAIPIRNPSTINGAEGIWGYADYTPTAVLGDTDGDNLTDDGSVTPDKFYTHPDAPFTTGISSGSGGGDAFDIAWAIDAVSGLPANLPGFDFIRIRTAVHAVVPPFGEFSAEIDAVSDVAPDSFGDFDADEDIDLIDVGALQSCMHGGNGNPVCTQFDEVKAGNFELADALTVLSRLTGPEQHNDHR